MNQQSLPLLRFNDADLSLMRKGGIVPVSLGAVTILLGYEPATNGKAHRPAPSSSFPCRHRGCDRSFATQRGASKHATDVH